MHWLNGLKIMYWLNNLKIAFLSLLKIAFLNRLSPVLVSFFAGVLFMHWSGTVHSVAFGMYALFLFLTGIYARMPLIRYFAYFFWIYSSFHLIVMHAHCLSAPSSLIFNSINASTGLIFI